MEQDYLGKRCKVKLITGEELPEEVCYFGISPLAKDIIWFAIPKPGQGNETLTEYFVPKYTIASIVFEKT